MPLGSSAAPLPCCLSPSLSAPRLMHHARQRPPSFVQTRCECVSACVCMRLCCASHQRDPAPLRTPIALSPGILNAAHGRPIACHRDSLAETKKKRRRVRFSEALTEVGRRSILGETSLTSVVFQSPIIFCGISLVLSL